MALLTLARILGDADTLLGDYRRSSPVMTEVGRDHGLILHAAAPYEEGLLVVNLWPSRAGSEAAAADPRRNAVIRGLGLTADRMRREHHEVADWTLFAH